MHTTLGIDLASQSTNTGLCVIAWHADRAEVVALARGAWAGAALTDTVLCDAALGRHIPDGGFAWGDDGAPRKVGIDAPFGWPAPFVSAVAAHHGLAGWPAALDEKRTPLERRATDHFIHDHVGKLPLSVSTDRIAYPAMRCAAILADLGRHLGPDAVARDGSGVVAETYPDGALRQWLEHLWSTPRPPSYKGPSTEAQRRRAVILDALRAQLGPSFSISDEQAALCIAADDNLDALVCALVAEAVLLGTTMAPLTVDHRALAPHEGWIHVPERGTLSALVPHGG